MREKQKGSVMVEATIYFPLVICTIMVFIYMGLFKLQENIFFYYTDLYANAIAKEQVYPGYSEITGSDVNFEWTDKPSDSEIKSRVKSYYETRTSSLSMLYSEISSLASSLGGNDTSQYENDLKSDIMSSSLLAINSGLQTEVDINVGMFGTQVEVTTKFGFDAPGVFQYLGITDDLYIGSRTRSLGFNSAQFVRNVDFVEALITDILDFAGVDSSNFKSYVTDAVNKLN